MKMLIAGKWIDKEEKIEVRDPYDYRLDSMPFGGVKGSGIGREGVRFSLMEMTEPKVVCFNLHRPPLAR